MVCFEGRKKPDGGRESLPGVLFASSSSVNSQEKVIIWSSPAHFSFLLPLPATLSFSFLTLLSTGHQPGRHRMGTRGA